MDKIRLDGAVQELWNIHGSGAFKAAMVRAEASDRLGQAKLAQEWREIAQACKGLKDPSPPK